jgi:hypothetical protein
MTDLRHLLRSAALFPRAGLDESALAERTIRRRRRRRAVVVSSSAAVLAALVGVVGAMAAGGDDHHSGSRVEVSSGASTSSYDTTTSVDTSTVPGPATSLPDATAPLVSTPTTAFVSSGTLIVPDATIPTASVTVTTGSTDTTQPTATTEPTTTTVPPGSDTGVVGGRVSAGPTCPVEPPGGCPPKPVVAAAVQAIDSSGNVVASDATDGNGNYALTLTPGQYTLHVATTGTFPRCSDILVTVTAGGSEHHDIGCDTGIR